MNLVAVIALAAIGAAFCLSALRGDARLARIAVLAAAVFCLADWVLIEDLGFLGGLGTDPNSMIPLILLFTAGYLAMSPAPQPEPAAAATAEDAGPAADAQPGAPATAAVTAPGVADDRGSAFRGAQRLVHRRPRRDRRDRGRRGADGVRLGEPQRGPDHRPGPRRRRQAR